MANGERLKAQWLRNAHAYLSRTPSRTPPKNEFETWDVVREPPIDQIQLLTADYNYITWANVVVANILSMDQLERF